MITIKTEEMTVEQIYDICKALTNLHTDYVYTDLDGDE